MNRDNMISKLEENGQPWEIIVIGGGASGLGIALEAVTRGYKTLLLEQCDFSKGTSSRSTKLIHGGVRYLAQGNVSLVREALRERGILQKNAPHLVKVLPFIIPCYHRWEILIYTVGLTLYDWLAGRLRIGRSRPVSKHAVSHLLPQVKTEKLRGGLIYYDCQFDDSRLAVNLCQSLSENGGVAVNYMKVTGLLKEKGKITGLTAIDRETEKNYQLKSKRVVNATGVFVNEILRMDMPEARDMVVPSQGIHLVVSNRFLNGNNALMIPKTPDGRVLFAVPWYDKVVIGTTDVEKKSAVLEPYATDDEIEYILETAGRYLKDPPKREDILSVFAGLRPLAAPNNQGKKTKEISRGHKISISGSGLVSLTGGKWTTFRKIGQDVIDRIEKDSRWPKTLSVTDRLMIHGYSEKYQSEQYGSDLDLIHKITDESPEAEHYVSEKLKIKIAVVILAVRYEMARTLEDVLARRTRALQLDAGESIRMAPAVAAWMAKELDKDRTWQDAQLKEYTNLAQGYIAAIPAAESG